MNRLLDKIEAIRKEPEHIRMRYVAISVSVSMVLVVLLWIFSVYEGFRSVATQSTSIPEISLPQTPSIRDMSRQKETNGVSTGDDFFQSEQMKRPVDDAVVEQ